MCFMTWCLSVSPGPMYIASCEQHLFSSGLELLVQVLYSRAGSALGMTPVAKFVRYSAWI